LLSKSAEHCDIYFFGKHDRCVFAIFYHISWSSLYRAIVSKIGIQELKGQPPVPQNKHIYWNQAEHELTKYQESIKQMQQSKHFLSEQ